MSSCLTPLLGTNRSNYFSPNEKVFALNGNKQLQYPAIFVRKVDENTSIITWDSKPKVEVRIQSSMILSINSTSGTRSRTRRSSDGPTSPTYDTTSSIQHSNIKRQKLFGDSPPKVSNDLPQRVAKVFMEDDQLYFGSAVSYDDHLWTIKYDDGDVEEYSETEMTQVLDTYKRNEHLDADGGGNHGQGQNPSSRQAITGNESSSEEEAFSDSFPSVSSTGSQVASVDTAVLMAITGNESSSEEEAFSDSSPSVSSTGSQVASVDTVVLLAWAPSPTDFSASDSSVLTTEIMARVPSPAAAVSSVLSTGSIVSNSFVSAAADTFFMDEYGVGESDNEQQSGESDPNTNMEDHSNDELRQLIEFYTQNIKLFESYSIEDFARKAQDTDILAQIEVSPDADSFVFGTQEPEDFHSINSTEEFQFQEAHPNVRPFSVRPAIKKTKFFKPSYSEGKTPTMPSKLHKFPSFSAGIVKFKGGVTAYLSIHMLEATKLGKGCTIDVTNTWNAANNLALTDYRDSSVANDPLWEEQMELYKRMHAPQTYPFTTKKEANRKQMCFPGIIGILHLRIVYEMLEKIATGSYGENTACGDYPRDPGAAKLLCTLSFILLQAPGFKKQWGMMQSQHDKQKAEVFQVMKYENDYAIWNQKLKAMTIDTYQRAEAFFINLPIHREHNDSAFYAIDIALKIGCTDDNWDVLLSGEAAEDTVVAATKLRRSELREVDEESTEQDESSISDGIASQPHEEDSDISWTPADSRDQERTDDNDQESQPEDQVTDDDDGELSQLLELMDSHDNPSNPDIISRQAPEGHEMHTAEVQESTATLHSGQRDRIRYPTFGTTGVSFGNAQSKPGINLEAICVNGDVFVSHPAIAEGKLRSVSLAQMYQPYSRFGMGVQTMPKIRLEARNLPKMIAEYASEFETLLVGGSGTKNGEVFAIIDKVFVMIQQYLRGLSTHPLDVRYELTFVTDMNNHMDILPPINDNTSPFKCIRFAKKTDIYNSMKTLLSMHRGVMNGFSKLKDYPHLSRTIPPDQWTAIIASAEALVNFIGMGGGAKGTILKQSLDKSSIFYFNHYWMPHPKFITLLQSPAESLEGNINQLDTEIIRFGVDSNLLALATPQRPIENRSTNCDILKLSLDYVDRTLSVYLLEGLRTLDQPAPYRNCMLLIYTALLAAGKQECDSEVTIFDRIQWAGVGQQVAYVNYVFKEIAAALVALYKVEWANRNTRSIEKTLQKENSEEGMRRVAIFQKKRKQFVLDLRDSHTKSQLGTLIRDCLGNDWPFAEVSSPFDSGNSSSSKMTQAGRAT
jgi:hypothetical protein